MPVLPRNSGAWPTRQYTQPSVAMFLCTSVSFHLPGPPRSTTPSTHPDRLEVEDGRIYPRREVGGLPGGVVPEAVPPPDVLVAGLVCGDEERGRLSVTVAVDERTFGGRAATRRQSARLRPGREQGHEGEQGQGGSHDGCEGAGHGCAEACLLGLSSAPPRC